MDVLFSPLVLLVLKTVSGNPLELPSPAGVNPVNASKFGVDVTRCSAVTLQFKSCGSVHVRLGDGSGPGSYEIAIAVADGYRSTELRHCGFCWHSLLKSVITGDILDCSSYRTFWLSWSNNRIAFGKGWKPGVDIVFDEPHPNTHEIQALAFLGYTDFPAIFRIGAKDKSRFEKVSDSARFSDTPLVEITTTFADCTHLCHQHENCGMLSYNSADSACAVFDRMTSSFTMTPQSGWKSWKMLYCWI